MYKRGGRSTSALLQKVTSQLKGEKGQAGRYDDDDDDDLGAYLNTIGKKKPAASQPQWDKFGELSDSTVSDNENIKPHPRSATTQLSGAGSKFLKKKAPPAQRAEVRVPNPQPNNSHGNVSQSRQSQVKGQQAGLSTVSHQSRQPAGRVSRVGVAMLSDSDLDIDMSVDEEVIADVKTWKNPSNKSAQKSTYQKPSYHIVDSDDSSSMQFGHGSKFLKKKPEVAKQPEVNRKVSPVRKNGQQTTQNLRSAERFAANMALDSDEESMAKMMGMMSDESTPREPKSPRTPRGILKTPRSAGHTPRSPSAENDTHRRPVFRLPLNPSDDESVSSVESFKMNVMDFNDLEPVVELQPVVSKKPKTDKKKKHASPKPMKKGTAINEDNDDMFKLMGLQSVDDLLGGGDVLSMASVHTGGVTSEIQTEVDDMYNSAPLKSILATTPRNTTPRSARSRVRYSLKEVTGARSRSPSPEVILTARDSDATSYIHTQYDDTTIGSEISTARTIPDEDDESYSDDFSQSSPDRTPRSSYRRQDSDAYSDDFTYATSATRSSPAYSRSSSRESAASYSDDYTSVTESSRSRTPSPDRKRHGSMKTCAVQTGTDMGLLYHWNAQTASSAVLGPQYGMAFVDPTPIATHVVSAEALEAVTAYSPSVVALNDMLRQQLELTKQHLEMQKRMYENYSRMAIPDHQYTTLEDTKQFIKKHRKPRLTFKEALKQVKREMGLK